MENIINIAELLKGCPKGMELDCTIFENLEFDHINKNDEPYPIICRVKTEGGYYNTHSFTEYGCYSVEEYSKCVIFPKGKNTWEGFHRPFKDGDIVAGKNYACSYITIFRKFINDDSFSQYVCLTSFGDFKVGDISDNANLRFATEEEKQKLFGAIKAKGYKWNEETKTLDKLSEPHTSEKFYIRIGEIPSEERSAVYNGDAVVGYENGVSVYDCIEADGLYHIVMPFPLKEGQGMTYECLIQEITQCRYEIEKPRNVYLVSGTEVGRGHDNEPLIKEVKILKDLTGQFNTKNYNTEKTKTLEKLIEPKFKVGDRIKSVISSSYYTVVDIKNNQYFIKSDTEKYPYQVPFSNEINYKLVPNIEPKFKVGDKITDKNNFIYRITEITDKGYKLHDLKASFITFEEANLYFVKVVDVFDIATLKPFKSSVLIRDYTDEPWVPSFWGKYIEDDSNCRYLTTNGYYKYCIPYEDNEHLLGTTNDCDEFYKNWE